jgi:hypothetical protein
LHKSGLYLLEPASPYKEFQMAYVLRHLVNDGILVDLGERLSGEEPFDNREAAEQRLSELERDKNNGKFSIEELVLSSDQPAGLAKR